MARRNQEPALLKGGVTDTGDTGASDRQRIPSGELSFFLSQPRTPRVVIRLLRNCGLSHANIAEAVGASTTSVANWSAGKSEPSDALYERLDFLRAVASHILASRLDGDDERIVKAFVLGSPQGMTDKHDKKCTTLVALSEGRDDVVIDAVRAFGAPKEVVRSPQWGKGPNGGAGTMGDTS
jgi:DNA-binding transcriptional regulator YiaG